MSRNISEKSIAMRRSLIYFDLIEYNGLKKIIMNTERNLSLGTEATFYLKF